MGLGEIGGSQCRSAHVLLEVPCVRPRITEVMLAQEIRTLAYGEIQIVAHLEHAVRLVACERVRLKALIAHVLKGEDALTIPHQHHIRLLPFAYRSPGGWERKAPSAMRFDTESSAEVRLSAGGCEIANSS
jgi:hypothetical protein